MLFKLLRNIFPGNEFSLFIEEEIFPRASLSSGKQGLRHYFDWIRKWKAFWKMDLFVVRTYFVVGASYKEEGNKVTSKFELTFFRTCFYKFRNWNLLWFFIYTWYGFWMDLFVARTYFVVGTSYKEEGNKVTTKFELTFFRTCFYKFRNWNLLWFFIFTWYCFWMDLFVARTYFVIGTSYKEEGNKVTTKFELTFFELALMR